jgi:hypothetical protein
MAAFALGVVQFVAPKGTKSAQHLFDSSRDWCVLG